MAQIRKIDTDGNRGLLAQGELGYDGYVDGGDEGRVYVGTGTKNIAIASKAEVEAAANVSDVVTSLELNANTLKYIDEVGTETDIDLSLYLDDTNLSRLVGGTLDGATGIATFRREDDTTFDLDLSALLDDTKVTVEDVLTSTSVVNALSANMGKELKTAQDNLANSLTELTNRVSDNETSIQDLQSINTIVEW